MDSLSIAYGSIIALLTGAVVVVSVLYKNKKADALYSIVKKLVDEAELKFGSGTGELKYNYVVKRLYSVMPCYVRLFVSEKLLDLWIEKAVDELQEILQKKIEEGTK